MEREKTLTMFDNTHKRQYRVYVTYEDRQGQKPEILRVQLPGDLLDITEKLTEKERRSIERRLA